MVFSSIPFLYYFLPVVLFCYFLVPRRLKNGILLIASFFFYSCGEPRFVFLLFFSGVFNYWIGKKIEKGRSTFRKRWFLFSLLVNFGMLFFFKYYFFVPSNFSKIFPGVLPYFRPILPIGISFFTFQAVSYVTDIYRKKQTSAKTVFSFLTYLSFFPQLIAGPIVRYETISAELSNRKETIEDISKGIRRFVVGLSKKVLLADVLGAFSATLKSFSPTVLGYWVQALANTFQLYFDFSGYSDMAIGLGLVFGFHFLENFNYPLIASTITDFWRRWHISLSSWFRDYVYIPLGGSRVKPMRHIFNILVVWACTGFWHGASWNFLLWGMYFAFFLILEKTILAKWISKHPKITRIVTIPILLVSFVLFNETDLSKLGTILQGMFFLDHLPFLHSELLFYLKDAAVLLFFSCLFATPIVPFVKKWLSKRKMGLSILSVLEVVFPFVFFFLSTMYLIDSTFQPFLYFRF